MKNKKEILFLLGLFFIALALRLGFTLFLKANYPFFNNPGEDVQYYFQWAQNIAYSNWIGKEVFLGLPLYPYILATLLRISLGHMTLIRLFFIILGSINPLLVYSIAKKIFSKKVGYIAAILTATNFILIYYSWLLMPVTLLTTIGLLVTLLILDPHQLENKRNCFFFGLFIGLATLGDGKFLIFLALYMLSELILNRKQQTVLFIKKFLPVLCGFFFILLSVAVRNKIVGNDNVLISAKSGYCFYVGNNPDTDGVYHAEFIRPNHEGLTEDQKIVAETVLQKRLNYSQASRFWTEQALEFIRRNPIQYANLLWKKALIFLTETEKIYDIDLLLQQSWRDRLDINSFRLVCSLAILGMIIGFIKKEKAGTIQILIVSQFLFSIIFFTLNRHRATILPFLFIWQSYAIVWLATQLKEKRIRPLCISLSVFIFFFIILKTEKLPPQYLNFLRLSKEGPIFVKQNEYAKAEWAYLKALRLKPNDAPTLYNLATLYTIQKRYHKAIRVFNTSLAINPLNPDSHYNLAYALRMVGNTKNAIDHYNQVIQLEPKSLDAYFQIAEIYRSQGQCSLAQTYYQRVIKENPSLTGKITNLIHDCPAQDLQQ